MPEVRLSGHGESQAVVSVDRLTAIIEISHSGGVRRFLRSGDADEYGLPLYFSLGEAERAAAGTCPTCRDPSDVYVHRLGDTVATDAERHSALLRCEDCRTLYEVVPEERGGPRRLHDDEAGELFPGAL